MIVHYSSLFFQAIPVLTTFFSRTTHPHTGSSSDSKIFPKATLKVKTPCLFERFLFQRYLSPCSKIDDVTDSFSTRINHRIKKISGNIGVMLIKLGTNDVMLGRKQNDTNFDAAFSLGSNPFLPDKYLHFGPVKDRKTVLLEKHEVPILPHVSSPAHRE